MKKLPLHLLFLLGLAIRLALIFTSVSSAVTDWFVPFLDATTERFTLDPWSLWMHGGGTGLAFPYGYAMWFLFLPLTVAAKVLGIPLQYAYGFTLLAGDCALLSVLRRLLPGRDRLLLGAYWLSPIVILASYGLGFNDVLPALLLVLALYFTRELRLQSAGAACIAAVSAKLSMALAVPFFVIYLYNNRALRQLLPRFVRGALLAAAVLVLPFLFSDSGWRMVFGNREIGRVYSLALDVGADTRIYLVPLIYLVMLYLVWRVRRLNYELFHATLGMVFLLVVLMTPAAPGWFIWALPWLVSYQAMSGTTGIALAGVFSGLYLLSTLLTTPLHLMGWGTLDLLGAFRLSAGEGSHAASLLHTVMVASGVILTLRIWREGVTRNDYFRLSRKPFVVGVAGDSGAGKDTFCDALAALFGSHSVATVSGDDYHLWDRQKPMWQVMTHLNPKANDLEGFVNAVVALTDGRSIQSRHYDHGSGKMSRPFTVKSNDFIIASGLHALYLPMLRDRYDLSIFLDIDEGLRRHFKVVRDVEQRGHSTAAVLQSFERREPDAARFIRPQAEHADLILSLQPAHEGLLEHPGEKPLTFKLVARSRLGMDDLLLRRVLVGVCGLHVEIAEGEGGVAVLSVQDDASSEDIALAARLLCPSILEFLDIEPGWEGGALGLMQLVTLTHINQALTRRFV
ncbi:hypothetical protein LPW11_17790 [Geomonas sp. RF6]|uniref:hypothetical protein n=1 Tax=Geomonas sp. RF6 TaxID=2897342 RepID=UPI001E482427|nr:hypothetical protein [Geomonas sp. RF6]UFS69734.1 hypothetical protein LPW11_17790 [Geomonas sp. RF6]